MGRIDTPHARTEIQPENDITLLLFDIDGTLLLSGAQECARSIGRSRQLFGETNAFEGIPVAGRTDPLLLNDAASWAGMELDAVGRKAFHDRYCDLLELEIVQPGPREGPDARRRGPPAASAPSTAVLHRPAHR